MRLRRGRAARAACSTTSRALAGVARPAGPADDAAAVARDLAVPRQPAPTSTRSATRSKACRLHRTPVARWCRCVPEGAARCGCCGSASARARMRSSASAREVAARLAALGHEREAPHVSSPPDAGPRESRTDFTRSGRQRSTPRRVARVDVSRGRRVRECACVRSRRGSTCPGRSITLRGLSRHLRGIASGRQADLVEADDADDLTGVARRRRARRVASASRAMVSGGKAGNRVER